MASQRCVSPRFTPQQKAMRGVTPTDTYRCFQDQLYMLRDLRAISSLKPTIQ